MTKSSEYDRITDELLSAYIDDAVSDEERAMVDAAVAADAEVAWRLDTLQQTVLLIRSLPQIALPRSFALTQADLAVATTDVSADAQSDQHGAFGRFIAGLGSFWGQGSGIYRNLATASLALLIVAIGANGFFSITDVGMTGQSSDSIAPEFEMAQMAEEPAAAPVQEFDAGLAKSEASIIETEAGGTNAATLAETTIDDIAAADTSAEETDGEMNAMAVLPTEEPPMAAAAAVPQAAMDEVAGAAAGAGEVPAEAAMSEAAPIVALEMSPPLPSADEDSAITPAVATGRGIARGASPAGEAEAAERLLDESLSDEIALAGQPEEASASQAFGAMAMPAEEGAQSAAGYTADQEIEAGPASADMAGSEAAVAPAARESEDEVVAIVEEEAAIVEESEEIESESMPDSVAALPAPVDVIPPASAPVSPLDYPYPPSPEPKSFFQARDLATLNILIVGLLALTLVFGGLWWRSRDDVDKRNDDTGNER